MPIFLGSNNQYLILCRINLSQYSVSACSTTIDSNLGPIGADIRIECSYTIARGLSSSILLGRTPKIEVAAADFSYCGHCVAPVSLIHQRQDPIHVEKHFIAMLYYSKRRYRNFGTFELGYILVSKSVLITSGFQVT